MTDFDYVMRDAAKIAEKAVARAMTKYKSGLVTDEDDITGVLIGYLDSAFDTTIGGLKWSSSILRHRRGVAAEESSIGADILIHVALNTPSQSYSKGVLVQAKRIEPYTKMKTADFDALNLQCRKMQDLTASSFIFDYAKGSMRVGSASRITGSKDRELYKTCAWTPYRFFFELFRCPIGDSKLTSAKVVDLDVPNIISLSGKGKISGE